MNQQSYRRPRTDDDRRRHLKIARGDLITSTRNILLGRLAESPHKIALAGNGEIGANTQQGRYRHPLQQSQTMIIDFVRQPRIAGCVGRRRIVQPDGTAVGHDDALPDDQGAVLPIADGAIVAADQPRPLGNEQGSAAWTVVNPFRDLSGHKTGQVGSQAGNQACGNHAAGRHYIR